MTRTKNGSLAIRATAPQRSQSPATPDSTHGAAAVTPIMALRQSIEAGCLLTESEAARFLGLRVKTLQRWRVYKRGVRWIKLSRAVRYDPADLIAYIEAGRHTPNHEPVLP
jgi:hypothetical protein